MKHGFEILTAGERDILRVVLQSYLDQFTDAQIETAPPTSAIRNAVEAYNRLKNILHGSVVDFDICRKPMHRLNGGSR
jgi:hypothetical protein